MSDGMRRELAYLSSHATNRYFIPNWGNKLHKMESFQTKKADAEMVSALGLMLWFVISTKMQDRGSCLRYP